MFAFPGLRLLWLRRGRCLSFFQTYNVLKPNNYIQTKNLTSVEGADSIDVELGVEANLTRVKNNDG